VARDSEKGPHVADPADPSAEPAPGGRPARRRTAEPAAKKGGPMQFVHECWAELQRVEWPDRRQLWTATGVVIIVCVVIGVYLAVIDAGLTRASSWLVRQYANH
jgi:preprotein translocase subunit SecE